MLDSDFQMVLDFLADINLLHIFSCIKKKAELFSK